MTAKTSLRIDTMLRPVSYIRRLLYSTMVIITILLAWLAQLFWWQYTLLFLLTAVIATYIALSRPVLLRLSQPPLSKPIDRHWQLLMRTAHGDALWQANLVAVHHYQWMVGFEFTIIEPYQRSISLIVFRDQVSLDDWQKLSILTTVIPPKSLQQSP